jgi:hypothetical protein
MAYHLFYTTHNTHNTGWHHPHHIMDLMLDGNFTGLGCGGIKSDVLEFAEGALSDPMKVPDDQRRTSRLMSKYELARVLGTRALQLRYNPAQPSPTQPNQTHSIDAEQH